MSLHVIRIVCRLGRETLTNYLLENLVSRRKSSVPKERTILKKFRYPFYVVNSMELFIFKVIYDWEFPWSNFWKRSLKYCFEAQNCRDPGLPRYASIFHCHEFWQPWEPFELGYLFKFKFSWSFVLIQSHGIQNQTTQKLLLIIRFSD